LAILVCTTAANLGDSYCALAWGNKLAAAAGPAIAAAILRGLTTNDLTARERALVVWARKVARSPNATTAQDVEDLRAAGIREQEIFEATAFVAFRYAFSAINDALGARPDWQLAKAAPPEVIDAITFGRPIAERAANA
jgi:alkylhydroperoxidase family enzyme